jgi:predicted lipoprotein with Yx(FWY)xxD motif
MPTMRRMVAFPGLLVALLGGAAAAQDTSSALSTILQTAKSDLYGAYLVTAEGRPIYIFSADTPRSAGVDANTRCSDACTRQWPPLIASAGAVASPEIDVALISKTQREDGASQVLFGGIPCTFSPAISRESRRAATATTHMGASGRSSPRTADLSLRKPEGSEATSAA